MALGKDRYDTRRSEGDMEYCDDTGLFVPVSGTATTGYVPTKQADGTVAWAAAGTGSSPMIGYAGFSASGGSISSLSVAGIVSTVTRVSAGRYTVTFTSAQSNNSYHPVITCSDDSTAAMFCYLQGSTLGTSSFDFYTYAFGPNTPQDRAVVRVSIFRYV